MFSLNLKLLEQVRLHIRPLEFLFSKSYLLFLYQANGEFSQENTNLYNNWEKTLNLPVFAWINLSNVHTINAIIVNISNVNIKTDDYLIADEDGIVIIPNKIIFKIIAKAKKDLNSENKMREAILNGTDPQEAYLKYGKF